ncbi:MAG: DNA polymerase subunit beta [Archaeoglobus sp.]|nr:MAG: DNA polymerase subunit beta [Archaeoglobus sp.]
MSTEKPVRLRDFVKFENCYFSVVSYFNNPEVKCLLRYAPAKLVLKNLQKVEKRGDYVKLSHEQALNFFEEYRRNGIFYLPLDKVKVFKPEILTPKLVEKDDTLRKVYSIFKIPPAYKGVTGSRLIGLNRSDSDVDFVVYGKWWKKAREKLIEGIKNGFLSQPDEECWKKIYNKRRPVLDFDTFVLHEERKFHKAIIDDVYFDLLYVRDYDRINEYPEFSGIKVGVAEIVGTLKDDSAVFDYPARYPLEDVKFEYIEYIECESSNKKIENKIKKIKNINRISSMEVLSFTHTYTGQAFAGERVRAYGVIEVGSDVKLIVGTRRECDEFIISESLVRI